LRDSTLNKKPGTPDLRGLPGWLAGACLLLAGWPKILRQFVQKKSTVSRLLQKVFAGPFPVYYQNSLREGPFTVQDNDSVFYSIDPCVTLFLEGLTHFSPFRCGLSFYASSEGGFFLFL
jgi:hypothetical protein